MAKTKTIKCKGPNTMTLLPGRRPMPAGKRMPSLTTTKKSKSKSDFKVKTLLKNPKKSHCKKTEKQERKEK